jgi:hypothetical protein
MSEEGYTCHDFSFEVLEVMIGILLIARLRKAGG